MGRVAIRPLATLLLGVVVWMAGCQSPFQHGPSPPSTSTASPPLGIDCAHYACLADPSSKNYRVMLEQFGLRQINNDTVGEFAPQVEGDWVAWQAGGRWNGTDYAHIWAFNFLTNQIYGVSADPERFATLQYLSNGRVVHAEYSTRPDAGADGIDHLVLWDGADQTSRKIETGMGGKALPAAFLDGWVVFRQRGGPDRSTDGLWALNVDDGRRVKVYTPPAGGPVQGTRSEFLDGVVIANDRVYYVLDREDKEIHEGNSTIFEFELESRSLRAVEVDEQGIIGRLAASENYLAWETPRGSGRLVIRGLRLGDYAIFQPSNAMQDDDSFPSIGGEWATYDHYSSTDDFHGIVGYHLPTANRFVIMQRTDLASSQESSTDGSRVVLNACRGGSPGTFDDWFCDLYWRTLPEEGTTR